MNYSMGSGMIDTLELQRYFQSSMCFKVLCTSKFHAFQSSVCFEVSYTLKFYVGTLF